MKTVRGNSHGGSHTAGTEQISRNKVSAVSALRGDVRFNSYYAERLLPNPPRAVYPSSKPALQIEICRQLFKLNISCICFYFASPTDRFSNRSSWYLHFTRVSASYKHHIRRQSATNTSCISFHKNFRGRAIV